MSKTPRNPPRNPPRNHHSRTPSAYARLLEELEKLPGVGSRSAQRIAFHLLKGSQEDAAALADAVRGFKSDLKVCSECGNVTETDPCPICADPQRDAATVLVVEQPTDIAALEQTGAFRGRYHVLMGRMAAMEGVGPGELNVQRLVDRVRAGTIREVVLGTNPTLEGDGTALMLQDQLQELGVRVTRLARGLPTGASLDGVSKAVLSDAIQGRGDF